MHQRRKLYSDRHFFMLRMRPYPRVLTISTRVFTHPPSPPIADSVIPIIQGVIREISNIPVPISSFKVTRGKLGYFVGVFGTLWVFFIWDALYSPPNTLVEKIN